MLEDERNAKGKTSSIDIFQLITETAEREKRKVREALLAPFGVEEFFIDGTIAINKRTCQGVECKLCIEVCPTNALYWKTGEVGIVENLCIYCGACVVNCIVDDCIRISRKRAHGEVETFSKPSDFFKLQHIINNRKRYKRVIDRFT